MSVPIHIIKHSATKHLPEAVEWTAICHNKIPTIIVYHDPRRATGRWTCVERKRPWLVYFDKRGPRLESVWSSHTTLEHALVAARKLSKELDKEWDEGCKSFFKFRRAARA